MALPPSLDGAVQVIVAARSPAWALTMAGAPGTAAGTTALLAADSVPAPTALAAWTVNV